MGEMASWSPDTPQPLEILLWGEPPTLAGDFTRAGVRRSG